VDTSTPQQGGGTELATATELWEDDDSVRRVGGPTELAAGTDTCHLRVLMDHSCIEVFTGTGEVLSTRIYRCAPTLHRYVVPACMRELLRLLSTPMYRYVRKLEYLLMACCMRVL
jgi:Glycosyl hydrolases family 32 C terminal